MEPTLLDALDGQVALVSGANRGLGAAIADEAGRLDVLVNNAGVMDGGDDTLESTTMGTVDDVLAVNLRGAIALARAALPLLLERHGARVVNVSSRMGALGRGMGGGSPAYRISKTGLNGLTGYLDAEYGPGLIANSVCPGWVRTDMGGPDADRSVRAGADTPLWCARFAPGSPGGRFYRDREVIGW